MGVKRLNVGRPVEWVCFNLLNVQAHCEEQGAGCHWTGVLDIRSDFLRLVIVGKARMAAPLGEQSDCASQFSECCVRKFAVDLLCRLAEPARLRIYVRGA